MFKTGSLLAVCGLGLCLISWALSGFAREVERQLMATLAFDHGKQTHGDPVMLVPGKPCWVEIEAVIEGPVQDPEGGQAAQGALATWARLPVHLSYRYWVMHDGLSIRSVHQTLDTQHLPFVYAGHQDLASNRVRLNLHQTVDRFDVPQGQPLTFHTLLERRVGPPLDIRQAKLLIYQKPSVTGMALVGMVLMYVGPALVVVGATLCAVGRSSGEPTGESNESGPPSASTG